MVVMAGGKGWGEMEKTMKNKRKPPTPPDSLTETGLSTFPTQLKAEWTEVDGAGREEKVGGGRGKGAVEGTRTFLFLFQRSEQSWGGGKVCVGDLKWPMMRRAQEIPFPRTLGSLKLGSGVTV